MGVDGVSHPQQAHDAQRHGEAVQDTIQRASLQEYWYIIFFLELQTFFLN